MTSTPTATCDAEELKLAVEAVLCRDDESSCPQCKTIRRVLKSFTSSADKGVTAAHDQDAPRVKAQMFKAFPVGEGKPVEVVFASFAACIERENNTLRKSAPSSTAETESTLLAKAVEECQIVLKDVAYGKERPWRDGAMYAAERCLRRILGLRASPQSASGAPMPPTYNNEGRMNIKVDGTGRWVSADAYHALAERIK